MNKILSVATLALLTSLTGACASDGIAPGQQGTQAVEQAIAEAHSAYQKAYEVEYAWRDTEALLQAARAAAAQGESDKALELARQVKLESEMAYKRYLAAQKAGPRYP